MKLEVKIEILEEANELINLVLSLSNVSIACDISAAGSFGERPSERGDKPTIMFRPIERNIELGCNLPAMIAGLTLRKVS